MILALVNVAVLIFGHGEHYARENILLPAPVVHMAPVEKPANHQTANRVPERDRQQIVGQKPAPTGSVGIHTQLGSEVRIALDSGSHQTGRSIEQVGDTVFETRDDEEGDRHIGADSLAGGIFGSQRQQDTDGHQYIAEDPHHKRVDRIHRALGHRLVDAEHRQSATGLIQLAEVDHADRHRDRTAGVADEDQQPVAKHTHQRDPLFLEGDRHQRITGEEFRTGENHNDQAEGEE